MLAASWGQIEVGGGIKTLEGKYVYFKHPVLKHQKRDILKISVMPKTYSQSLTEKPKKTKFTLKKKIKILGEILNFP